MKLVTFERNGSTEPGALLDDKVIGLASAGFPTLLHLIQGGTEGLQRVKAWLDNPPAEAIVPLAKLRLLAPLSRPPKIICVGLNYRDHALECNAEIPKVPTIFSKYTTAIIGPGEAIILPKHSKEPDYEAEFAVVIGKGGRYISKDRWREHVFGYTNLNDVSARDFQMATSQWMIGKTFDTFAPMGPWLVSADEIADPHALDISLRIGGETLQHSNTRELIFKIPVLVAFLSSVVTLEPGDVVATGTPAGVGFARTPPRYLQPGDEVVVSIEGVGELRNPVVAES